MNDVVWLSTRKESPARGYWDQQLLEDLFIKKTHHDKIGKLKEAIVVCPTEYQDVELVNKELAKLDRCIFIGTSDEENKFDLEKLSHKSITIFATYPHDTKADVTWLPIGYTPHSKTTGYTIKDIDLLFAGQINHDSRQVMLREISEIPTSQIFRSKGFAQGLSREKYIELMRHAKVVAAPKGNISPDSFRLYEALEHGAQPIAEDVDFFNDLFGHHPIPVISDGKQWQGYSRDAIKAFPVVQNRSSAWWHRYKEKLYRLFSDDEITVVIPVSPIKSHPDTRVIDETIRSIRHHLDCRIVVTFDGVRPEQEDKTDDYQLFINNFLASGYDRIYPIIFEEHKHQSGMMREIMDVIDTPYILYIEQDTPLVTDMDIEWDKCIAMLGSGDSNMVRFHFESEIPSAHKHMMIGQPRKGFLRTAQWSQRPHLATTAFYRRIMNECFSEGTNSFIEDNMHGKLWNAYETDGGHGWDQFRVHIYFPEGSIKRSYHTDGREGEPKWDDQQVF